MTEAIRSQLIPSTCTDAVGVVESYLKGMWQDGTLLGATPDAAYFTRCDRGSDVLRLGFALMRPTEFVVAKINLNAHR